MQYILTYLTSTVFNVITSLETTVVLFNINFICSNKLLYNLETFDEIITKIVTDSRHFIEITIWIIISALTL